MSKSGIADLKRLRERAGLTIEEVALAAGYSERQIRRYENGESTRIPRLYRQFLNSKAQKRTRRSLPPKPWFRFVDLFAGIGGLRLGFEHIGGRCVFTSEWDRYSQQTYRLNFPDGNDHVMAGDIRPFGEAPELIPDHDVLLAGFPCQPFSIAGVSKKNALGRPHGFDCDTQGTLFFEIERIIAHHRPVAFLLENVKNLERHDRGRTFAVIRSVLEDKLGYRISHKVVSSHPWVPQKRERIFIAGFREDSEFSFDSFDDLRLPPEDSWPRLGTVLNGHNSVPAKYTLTEHLWTYLQNYKKKHESKGNGFGCSVFGPEDVTRTLSARYYKDGSEILIAQKGTRPRRLMPDECARLMGFVHHDGSPWKIDVSDTQAYRQFGNAVVVPVVKAIAEHMRSPLEKALASAVTVVPLPSTAEAEPEATPEALRA